MIKQLETSQEPIHLYFLSSVPTQHQELKPFIREMLGSSDDPIIQVDLIDPSEAEAFVANVHKQMVGSGKIPPSPNVDSLPF